MLLNISSLIYALIQNLIHLTGYPVAKDMTIFCILYIFISEIAAISLVRYWFPLLTAVFFIAGCIKIANQNSFHASETFQHKKGEQVVQLLKKVLLFIILIELLIAEVTYTPLEHCKINQ